MGDHDVDDDAVDDRDVDVGVSDFGAGGVDNEEDDKDDNGVGDIGVDVGDFDDDDDGSADYDDDDSLCANDVEDNDVDYNVNGMFQDDIDDAVSDYIGDGVGGFREKKHVTDDDVDADGVGDGHVHYNDDDDDDDVGNVVGARAAFVLVVMMLKMIMHVNVLDILLATMLIR